MNRLKQTLKKSVAFGVTGIMLILAGCKSPAGFVSNDNEEYNARMEKREQLHSGLTRRL
jgi:putative aldouronate transport system substrate-binding protein